VDTTQATSVRQTFRPQDRLKRRSEFERVQTLGRKVHTAHFVLVVLRRSEGGLNRLGITVTRKIASAVGRNRIKRTLREVFRRNRGLFPPACDIVAIAKPGAQTLSYEEVRREIEAVSRWMAARAEGSGARHCGRGGTPS